MSPYAALARRDAEGVVAALAEAAEVVQDPLFHARAARAGQRHAGFAGQAHAGVAAAGREAALHPIARIGAEERGALLVARALLAVRPHPALALERNAEAVASARSRAVHAGLAAELRPQRIARRRADAPDGRLAAGEPDALVVRAARLPDGRAHLVDLVVAVVVGAVAALLTVVQAAARLDERGVDHVEVAVDGVVRAVAVSAAAGAEGDHARDVAGLGDGGSARIALAGDGSDVDEVAGHARDASGRRVLHAHATLGGLPEADRGDRLAAQVVRRLAPDRQRLDSRDSALKHHHRHVLTDEPRADASSRVGRVDTGRRRDRLDAERRGDRAHVVADADRDRRGADRSLRKRFLHAMLGREHHALRDQRPRAEPTVAEVLQDHDGRVSTELASDDGRARERCGIPCLSSAACEEEGNEHTRGLRDHAKPPIEPALRSILTAPAQPRQATAAPSGGAIDVQLDGAEFRVARHRS